MVEASLYRELEKVGKIYQVGGPPGVRMLVDRIQNERGAMRRNGNKHKQMSIAVLTLL